MKLLERIALIKAGYTKSEIAAIEAAEAATEPDNKEPETKPDDNEKEQSKSDPEENKKQEPETDPEPDYKKMYEETAAQLKAAQKINVNVNVGDDKKAPSPEENFSSWVTDNL